MFDTVIVPHDGSSLADATAVDGETSEVSFAIPSPAGEAIAHMAARQAVGKLVVTVD